MTLNVCVFGNSHIAALSDGAARSASRWSHIDFTFVGAHKNGLIETDCQDGILTPISEDAKESFSRLANMDNVDLRDMDAIVVTGSSFALSRAAFLYRKARWAALPSVQADPKVNKHWSLVSEPAFAAMLQATLLDTMACRFVRLLRRDIDIPIYVASQPRTTTGVRHIGKHSLDVLLTAIETGDAPALSQMHETNAFVVCDAVGAIYIPQDSGTIEDDVLTSEPFTRGAIRLSMKGRYPQPESDILHANAAYGKVVLDQIEAALARDFSQPAASDADSPAAS